MCCFSGKVRTVGKTRIFARGVEAGVQALVYQMNFDAEQEVAMILPLPVKLPIWEKAVRFVNLEGYDNFFEKLDKLFPQIVSRGRGVAETDSLAMKTLEVVQVGSYEASFVPTMEDFARLDNRFRIDSKAWAKLPQYKDYGFAVFKLKAGNQKVHPMAFVFETRLEGELFFPTVHIHDGEVHEKESFDHSLYAQGWENANLRGEGWKESLENAEEKIDEERAKGLVWGKGKVYRKRIFGSHPNVDQLLAAKA